MKNKVIAIDIIVMIVFILFPFVQIIIPDLQYPYFRYQFFVMYLYTFIKCILGIIILLHKIFTKSKIFYSWKYLISFLPSVILAVCYVYFIYFFITKLTWSIDGINFILRPVSRGLYIWFPSMELNILLSAITLIGIVFWLIYWTFYNKTIRKTILVLLNVITPINITFLFIEILFSYTK
jgi:hypothetical protein